MVASRSLLLVPALAMLVGCGTTVPLANQSGSGLPGDAPWPGGTVSSGTAGPDGASGSGSTGTATSGGSYGTGASSGSSPGSGGVPSPGVSQPGAAAPRSSPIKLGVVVPDASALLAAFGAKGPSDLFAAYRAQIDYLNAHGGIAGRKIQPVYVRTDATAQDGPSEAQKACAAMTQDHKVDVVLAAVQVSDVFLSCLNKRGVSSFDLTPWVADQVQLAQHPNLFAVNAIAEDRYARALIEVSLARGVLKSGDTLGVLTEDCVWGPRVYSTVVVPLAKRHGVKTATATFKCAQSLSGEAVAAAASETQQAVLKFRSAGVTHVIVLTAGEGFVVVQFQNNASGQQYYPKYLITTNAFPYNNGRRDGAVMFKSDALPNMSGIGFKPLIDIGDRARPAAPAQAAVQAACRQMDPAMGGAKADTGKTHHQTEDAFYVLCDTVLTLKAVLEANGVRYGIDDLRRGFRQVIATRASAAVVGGTYAPAGDRPDGIGAVRPFVWNADVNGFSYVGSPHTAP
jgi:hypothetical protein